MVDGVIGNYVINVFKVAKSKEWVFIKLGAIAKENLFRSVIYHCTAKEIFFLKAVVNFAVAGQ